MTKYFFAAKKCHFDKRFQIRYMILVDDFKTIVTFSKELSVSRAHINEV